MKIKLDLHVHSAASMDSRMPPEEIIAEARRKGLDGVAVCDHDVLSPAILEAAAAEKDFLLIPGTELSTAYGHLLAMFLEEPVPEQPRDEKGRVSAEALPELIDWLHARGALAVLAHPFEIEPGGDRLLPILPLLDGIEVWNARANRKRPTANAEAAAFARDQDLPRFAGSDAHVVREIGNGYVNLTVEELSVEGVRSALLEPDNPVSGCNGRSMDAAKSHLTKLRKRKAGPGARIKWLLLAAKCGFEDITRRDRDVRDR